MDPRRRLQAVHLIKDSYVTCDDLRMTAFEMAGTLARVNNIRTFKRDCIKIAHNKAVEQLRAKNYSQFDIELCFKEGIQSDSGASNTDQIYSLYKKTVV